MPATARQRLLADLESLRQVVAQALLAGPERPAGGNCTALVKLCQDANPEAAQELAGKAGVLALPLAAGQAEPQLARLLKILEALARETGRDLETGLPGAEVFARVLDLEMERTVRTKTALALALVRIVRAPENPGPDQNPTLPGPDTFAASVAEVLGRYTRRYDVVARLAGNDFALLFPGAGLLRARLTMERIMAELDKLVLVAPGLTPACAGVAGTKGLAKVPPVEFLALAREALDSATAQARDAGMDGLPPLADRIVAAPIPDLGLTPKTTLVHSQEKQFLFTGRID